MNTPARTPAISVLIPIYNVEAYLRRCLDSLRDQTFGDFEAICLNDGSTDESSSIAHAYAEADPRFRVVDKANSGYGATMNVGLDAARGTYIAVLESDDFFYPDALETLHRKAQADDAQAVKGNFAFYWTAGNRDELHRMIDADMCESVVDTRSDMRIFFQKPSIWSGLYRRDFLESNDIRFLETPGASYQDTSFSFKVWAACERAAFVENPIVHYRQDNEASSVNSKGKVFCVCDEFAEIMRWLDAREDGVYARALRHMAQVSQYNAYLWNLDRLAPEFKREFLVRMRDEFQTYEHDGSLHWEDWSAWRALNMRAIMNDPERYLRARCESHGESACSKALFALRIGGPGALMQALRDRKKSKQA
ncbi:MAG: glycosyltransferase [Slackia sp.]|nr:glycosyltransferase [Slackia sp.]